MLNHMYKDLNTCLLTTLFSTAILFVSCTSAKKQNLDICKTITGQAKDKPCYFPFSYNGVMKTKCTNLDSTFYWCSTEPEYHTKNFGECSSNCPRENVAWNNIETTSLTTFDDSPACKDKWKKCTSFSIPKYGCTDLDVQEGCRKSCNLCDEVTTGQNLTCTPKPGLLSGQCKTWENTPCVFPFTYQEKSYCECTITDDLRYWCATATPFSWTDFGYCNDDCLGEGVGPSENSVAGYKKVFDQTNRTCGRNSNVISIQRNTTLQTCSDSCSNEASCWYFFHNDDDDCFLHQSCYGERNGVSLGSTYLKDGCETVSGKQPNAPCVFPFKYQEKWHYACTDLGSEYDDEYWCATKNDEWYLENEHYGTCSSKCPVDSNCKANDAYFLSNLSCVFPFTYKGIVHYECTNDGLSKHWCPTQLSHADQRYDQQLEDYVQDGRYGYCNPDCPMEESGTEYGRNEPSCACTEFVDDGGRGKCRTRCSRKGLLCCYVRQPTNCKDARPSSYYFGEISDEPCQDANDEYLKYKAIKNAYCFPHTTEHPNILEAISECKRHLSCGMFFQQDVESVEISWNHSTFKTRFYLCSKESHTNLDASGLTTLYVLEENASKVLKQSTLVPDIKSSDENNMATKLKAPYVSFFTFVALVVILMFRAVIRAIRKISTYFKSFRSIFSLFCILFAGYMTMIESLRYFENKDTSTFGYKKFGESPQDKYPTFSICLKSISEDFFSYFEEELDDLTGRYGSLLKYDGILRGAFFYHDGVLKALQEISYKKFSSHDLDKISFHLKNFAHEIRFQDRNSDLTEHYEENGCIRFPNETIDCRSSRNATIPFHIGYKDHRMICFTRNSDSRPGVERRLDRISFPLKKMIATNLYISVVIHHPGQLTRSLDKPILESKASELKYNLNVIFSINQVSVLRRRPDAIKKCDNGLHDDDRVFRNKITRVVGCQPPYWMGFMENDNLLNECRTASEMAQILSLLKNKKIIFDSYKQPCDYMTVVTGVLQKSMEWGTYLIFDFVYMDDFYQEIINAKGFGFESFWSGVGGFVGIFLGYSLLQTPDLVQSLWASTSQTREKIGRICGWSDV